MITKEDSFHTYEYEGHYIIYPNYNWWGKKDMIPGGRPVQDEFEYSSGNNTKWLSVGQLQEKLRTDLGKKD